MQNTEIKSEVAILYSPENEYAFKIQPQTNGMYYLEQLMLLHAAFTKYGLNVDIVSQRADISGYKVVAAPELYVTDEIVVKNLYDFTRKGGTVILTNRSGVKNHYNNCIMEQLPTVYRELTGVYIEEYDPVGYDNVNVKFMDGSTYKGRQWCDVLHLESAEAVAVYDSEFYCGKPAITRNNLGRGTAYYIGTVGEKKLYQTLVKKILKERDITFVDGLLDNVEITTRTGGDRTVRFIFNNTEKEQSFLVGEEQIHLAPFEMKVDEV